MTRYIDVADMQQLVARHGVERMMREMADYIREDFVRWNDFDKSPRTANHSANGVIELMPVSDANRFAFKYVNGHPLNPLAGLTTVMAFGVLADVATGYPTLLSEMTITTALRTAAMSALAAGDRHQRARVEELCGLVVGRGACAHPDGTARLVRSLLTVFPVEVAGHALGQCRTELTDEGKVGVA